MTLWVSGAVLMGQSRVAFDPSLSLLRLDPWHGSQGRGGVGGGDLGWSFCAFMFDKGLLAAPVGGTQGAPPGPHVQVSPLCSSPAGSHWTFVAGSAFWP